MGASVGIVFCLCLLGMWLIIRAEDTVERRRNCKHELRDLYAMGAKYLHCDKCGYQKLVGWERDDQEREKEDEAGV